MEDRLLKVETDVSHMRSDITTLKKDTQDLKADVGELKRDVGHLKDGFDKLRGDLVVSFRDVDRKIDAKFFEVSEKMEEGFAEVRTSHAILEDKMDSGFAKMDTKMGGWARGFVAALAVLLISDLIILANVFHFI